LKSFGQINKRRETTDRSVGISFIEQLFDAVHTAAMRRQITTNLDVQLLQLEFVFIEHRVPQFCLFFLNA